MKKRGRRKVVEPTTPKEAEAKDYGRQRTVYQQGNSWVIAVPLWARRRLGSVRGGVAYWHDTRSDEVVLAATARRIAGRPIGQALQREVDHLRRENVRLRRRLRARPLTGQTEEIWQVMMKALPVALPIMATAEETRDLVREIHARIPWRGRTPTPPRARAAVTVPGPDAYPRPEPPASGEQDTAAVSASTT